MKTRVGKIAQLPRSIRDELNQRLENGKQGPELLKWLNSLPEIRELLAAKFDHQPINKQNLSEWRHGGYEEWLRHQDRERRIQRIAEEGGGLKQSEGKGDLFEDSARIALAEWMADMDELHELAGEERWKRLRGLTHELVRLQNGYNRSRWTELAWIKWNHRFLGPEDYETAPACSQRPAGSPPFNPEAVIPHQPTSTGGDAPENSEAPIEPPACSRRREEETPEQPVPEKADPRIWLTRIIYHCKGCGCVCRTCHPDNAEYPYTEAVKDTAEAKDRGALCFWRGYTSINTNPTECHCPCAECDQKTNRVSAPLPIHPLIPISPISPLSDFLRQAARRRSAADSKPGPEL